MAAPAAYGSSWARGQIRAAAADIHHSHGNTRFEPESATYAEAWIFNPLSKAGDHTQSSQIQFGFVTPEPQKERQCLLF